MTVNPSLQPFLFFLGFLLPTLTNTFMRRSLPSLQLILTLNTWNASNWMLGLLSRSKFIISLRFSGLLMYFVMMAKLCRSRINSPSSYRNNYKITQFFQFTTLFLNAKKAPMYFDACQRGFNVTTLKKKTRNKTCYHAVNYLVPSNAYLVNTTERDPTYGE